VANIIGNKLSHKVNVDKAVGSTSSIVSIICLVIALSLSLFYVCERAGFRELHADVVLKSLLFLSLLLGLPPLVRWLPACSSWGSAEIPLTWVGLAAMVAAGCLLPSSISLGIVCVIAVAGLVAIVRELPSLSARTWLGLLAGSSILGLWAAAYIYGWHARDPLYLEILPTGQRGYDQLYHITLVQTMRTYGILSSGLDGVPLLHYHAASHWIFWKWANVLSVSISDFYLISYPLIIAPLFFKAFLTAIDDLRSLFAERWTAAAFASAQFWIALAIVFIGCIPPALGKHCGLGYCWLFNSESAALTLAFVFMGISTLIFLERGNSRSRACIALFLPVWAALLTAAKVSYLAIVPLALVLLCVREKTFRSLPWLIGIPVATLSAYALNKLTKASEYMGGIKLSPGDFFNYMEPNYKLAFVVIDLLPIWFCIGYALFRFGPKRLIAIKGEPAVIPFQLVIALFACFFALVNAIELPCFAGIYFIEPLRWFANASILAVLPVAWYQTFSLGGDRAQAIKRAVATCVLALLIFDLSSNVRDAIALNLQERRAIARLDRAHEHGLNGILNAPQSALDNNGSYMLMQHLQTLAQIPLETRRQTLLFIPQSCAEFWRMSPTCHGPFLAPALSGMAMLDGMPPAGLEYKGSGWGYEAYKGRIAGETQNVSPSALLERAHSLGFQRVLAVDCTGNAVHDHWYGSN
jgi:hypothetical protein